MNLSEPFHVTKGIRQERVAHWVHTCFLYIWMIYLLN